MRSWQLLWVARLVFLDPDLFFIRTDGTICLIQTHSMALKTLGKLTVNRLSNMRDCKWPAESPSRDEAKSRWGSFWRRTLDWGPLAGSFSTQISDAFPDDQSHPIAIPYSPYPYPGEASWGGAFVCPTDPLWVPLPSYTGQEHTLPSLASTSQAYAIALLFKKILYINLIQVRTLLEKG